MKLATWNVNSLKVRLPQVLEWLESTSPDVLVMQELKQVTEEFAVDAFKDLGYHAVANGQRTYNGVAIACRDPVSDLVMELPGFDDRQRRVLAGTTGAVRIVNLYVPNGGSVGSESYDYKLRWLAALRGFLANELKAHEKLAVLGDFNIAPDDRDVYDPVRWGEGILCSPAERAALKELLDLGLSDVYRQFDQPAGAFSWWDYRGGAFRRNAGLRIDLILASPALARTCRRSWIDREPRARERPSDHAPVLAEFAP